MRAQIEEVIKRRSCLLRIMNLIFVVGVVFVAFGVSVAYITA